MLVAGRGRAGSVPRSSNWRERIIKFLMYGTFGSCAGQLLLKPKNIGLGAGGWDGDKCGGFCPAARRTLILDLGVICRLCILCYRIWGDASRCLLRYFFF